jgi:copper homeostasis protein
MVEYLHTLYTGMDTPLPTADRRSARRLDSLALVVPLDGSEASRSGSFSGMPVLLEACLDSLDLARNAERAGAGRIELCDRLDIGGTTPDPGLIEAVTKAVHIPVFVIIRPRGGDFLYSSDELSAMKAHARMARESGAAGIVLGALDRDDTIDVDATRSVMEAGGGLPATFHLAFDRVPDQAEALETLVGLGTARVLTSGGAGKALAGVDALRRLVIQARDRLTIMPGGGIREPNVAEIVRRTGAREIHTRGLAVAEILARANEAAPAGESDA